MTDVERFEDRFARDLRAYAAPAARPPRRDVVALAVAAGREARGGLRGSLRWPTVKRLPMAMAAGIAAIVLIAAAVVLSNLPQRLDLPPASLPTSPADWSRVELELPAGTGGIRHIAAGPRGLVAVTALDDSGESRVVFSTDGHDWSVTDAPPVRGEYVSVVGTDRGFLMTVSEDGAWTSENGLEWQQVASNWSGNPDVGGAIVVDVAAGGPGYVAVGNQNKVWYSTDGADWTQAQVPPPPAEFIRPEYPELTVDLTNVAAVGDHLVATGSVYAGNSQTGISKDYVLTSTDGKTWSTVLPDIGDRAGPLHLAAGPNGFLVIGGPLDGSNASAVWQSADGETWQESTTDDFRRRASGDGCTSRVRMTQLAAAGSGYVAVGIEHECMDGDIPASPPEAVVWTSQDGRSWSRLAESDVFMLADIQDGPGTAAGFVAAWGSRFVIGGMYGGEPAVWISGSSTSAEDRESTE